ncbi:hypothetical protein MFIFM68171_04548 [Madurella fahalii]|uniref:Rhodopsin domain-containing protein n=1 Tax=Madurella fahalii TaxID=1157608 RepID=A0ABQ0G994_9PEZI
MSGTEQFPPPVNPNDLGRGPMVMGITWTFTGLAVITTGLRLYVRKHVGPRLASDDWLMLFAASFQLVNQIFVSIAYHYGMGKHTQTCTYPTSLSICSSGSAMSAITCVCIFVQIDPVQGLWNPFLPNITSWSPHIVQDMMFLTQALYALADLAFVIIPIIIIWRLKMDMSRRLGLAVLMGMSLFTCAMSIMKGVSAISTTASSDPSYEATLSLLWATLEQAFVVLLGNVAPLRPLFGLSIPLIRTVTDLYASLLGRTSQTGSKASTIGSTTGYRNGAYHNIEINTHKLGKFHAVSHEVNGSVEAGSIRTPVGNGQVLRTNDFTVVYPGSDVSTDRR